jgi:hypothetical protein
MYNIHYPSPNLSTLAGYQPNNLDLGWWPAMFGHLKLGRCPITTPLMVTTNT